MKHAINCNLCGSDKYSIVYKAYDGDISIATPSRYTITDNSCNIPVRIVKCVNCGLIYANPRIESEKLTVIYRDSIDNSYLEEEKGRRLSARRMLKHIKKIKKTGRLLDIGCSAGFLLDEARKIGFEVYGVEPSKWAADHAAAKLRISTIFNGGLKEAKYPPNYFDCIILSDVIEHLEDPKCTLTEIRKILKPNGIICISTPDISSFMSKILGAKWWGVKQAHLYYFTRKSLYQMLKNSGFIPIKTMSHSRTFRIKYLTDKLMDYNKTLYRICGFLTNNKIKNRLLNINFWDQIDVYARKIRKLEYLDELETPSTVSKNPVMKITAVLPAYNAAKTLNKTVGDIPGIVNDIILVDDASNDDTIRIAEDLGIKVSAHKKNTGYGGNQKTCYHKALENGADIIVMVHPDYQYDPKAIPELVNPIIEGKADAVFGSRMMKGGALEGGMPLWKHNVNILLTALENVVFGAYLTEYHSGFRAYSSKVLRSINFDLNSDGFIFDTEIIAQILLHNFKIEEVPIRTRYFDEASSIKLWPSILYGMGILKTLLKYMVHTHTVIKFKQFK